MTKITTFYMNNFNFKNNNKILTNYYYYLNIYKYLYPFI